MGQSPETIRMRLQELLKFQCEKQNLLLKKQNAQRELLKQEQHQLYEMFGLSVSSISDLSSSNIINSPSATLETERARNEVPSATACQSSPVEVPAFESDSSKHNNDQTKRPFLKRNQGLTNRFKIDPSVLRLENLPKYKYAGSHRTSKFFREFIPVKKRPRPPVVCKVTSDLKLKPVPDMDCTPSRSTEEFEALEELDNDSEYCPLADDIEDTQGIEDKCCDSQSPISWANILNTETTPAVVSNENIRGRSITSLQNTPIREKIRHQQQEIDEPNIFQLLAEDTRFRSIPISISRDEEMPHDAIVKWDSHNVPIEVPEKPVDCRVIFDEENDDTLKNDHCHVRFANVVEMNEFDDASDADTLLSINDSSINAEQTSTPINKMPTANRANSPTNPDLKDKTEQMKAKLAELNREIEVFRMSNTEITKMKQSHELERIKLAEERVEMEQQLNDERIRLEVILHDERMKLADERTALEKRAKEIRAPNRKEREELIRLKEQIAKLERELPAKDQKHIAAQARLRAQIRTMEKDLKDYSYEIEQLKKENKKMDAENVRLRRQGNNKMLSEINRNIARLSCASEGVSVVPEKVTKQRTQSVPNLSKQKSLPPSSESESEPDEPEPIRNQTRFNVPAETQDNVQQSCKREILNEDGSRDVLYPNGNIKKISADTMLIRMLYYNKDIKETNIGEGTVKYYYAATNTWHTSYLDGLEILEFPK